MIKGPGIQGIGSEDTDQFIIDGERAAKTGMDMAQCLRVRDHHAVKWIREGTVRRKEEWFGGATNDVQARMVLSYIDAAHRIRSQSL